MALNHSIDFLGSCTMKLKRGFGYAPIALLAGVIFFLLYPIETAEGYQNHFKRTAKKDLKYYHRIAGTSLPTNSGGTR